MARRKFEHLIEIEVLSNNDLTKDVYTFEVKYGRLVYTLWGRFERDPGEVWADEWPEPMEAEAWHELHVPDWEQSYEGEIHHKYREHRDALNPCMNKTKDGRGMYRGQSGYNLAKDHPLPPGVGQRAKDTLLAQIKVEGLDF